MRISDWSSDVCSSDLLREFGLEKTLSFARPIRSAMFHEVIYPGGLDVTGRILVDRQCFVMCLSASDLCRFVVPQIIREQAALRFADEIEAFTAIRSEVRRVGKECGSACILR